MVECRREMRRAVLVTGCTAGGIGYCLAEEFASQGYNVYASARRPHTMRGLPPSVKKIALDVTSDESCQQAISTIIQDAGRLDVLVNNAAIGWSQPLMDTPIDDFRAHYETNVIGALRLTRLVVPHMAREGSGLIINIGSGLGMMNLPFTGAYSASKHALHNMTSILRLELNPMGIDVMLVAPGYTKTSMTFSPNCHAFSKPSAFGYEAFARCVDVINWMSRNLGSDPKQLARRIVKAADGNVLGGAPRQINFGFGVGMAKLHTWLPGWVSDWMLGLGFQLYPRWRAKSLMIASQQPVNDGAQTGAKGIGITKSNRRQHGVSGLSCH